jgi:hypothetical protein
MDQSNGSERFEASIYKWSLRFRNPDEERLYQQELQLNPPSPYMMKVVALIVIATSILYRMYALIAASMQLSTKTAGLRLELVFAVIVVGAALLELILWVGNCGRSMLGVLIYTTLNCVTTTAAFYTQKAPLFGVMYKTP